LKTRRLSERDPFLETVDHLKKTENFSLKIQLKKPFIFALLAP
jgi:hypothetical protein